MDSRFCLLVLIFCLGLFSVREVNAQIVPEKVSYQHSSMELYGKLYFYYTFTIKEFIQLQGSRGSEL
jgi:hypothetical protein